MEKTVKHRFLNNALFTALIVPLAFFVLRDTIAVLTGLMFESMGGKESFLYQINDDISRLIIAGLLMLILPIFSVESAISALRAACRSSASCSRMPSAKSMSLKAPIPSRWRSMTAAKTAAPMCLSFLMWVWVRRM